MYIKLYTEFSRWEKTVMHQQSYTEVYYFVPSSVFFKHQNAKMKNIYSSI